MNIKNVCGLTLMMAVFVISELHAKEMHGVRFEPTFEQEESSMSLRGVALKRVFLARAFVAGFYLEEEVPSEHVFEDVSKRIEVEYMVSIPEDKLSRYTETLMKKNSTPEEYDAFSDKLQLMRQYFVDLEPGDRYALTYIPGMGTRFDYNGHFVGVIPGKTFADSLFSTWVGEKPMDYRIKRQILGLHDHDEDKG